MRLSAFILLTLALLATKSTLAAAAPYPSLAVVPGIVEAVNYDLGGEGVAYHDLDAGNQGGAYRPLDGVDIQPSSEGGFNVAWGAAGEWLQYSINVQQAGAYRIEVRLAAAAASPPLQISLNGAVIGSVPAPATGGFQTWATQTLQVPSLAVGNAVLRVTFTGTNAAAGPNLKWLLFSLASAPAPAPINVPAALDPSFFDQVFTGGLTAPTDMAFAPDGRIFIAEKQGTIRVWKNGALLPAPFIDLIPEVHNAGDKGLLSIVLHPFFTTNKWLYMIYAVDPVYGQPDEDDFSPALHRLVRYTVAGDVADPASRTIILGNSAADGLVSCGNTHTAGKLRFAPDNTLMFTFGEGSHYEYLDVGNDQKCRDAGLITAEQDIGAFRAQSLNTMLGKVLRINPDTGAGVPGNPWYDASKPLQSRIWAIGLRNPFRWSFKPNPDGDLILIVSDVGNGDYEETNEIRAGDNAGWPCYEGRLKAPGYYDAKADMCSDPTKFIGRPVFPMLVYSHLDASLSYPVGVFGNAATGSTTYTGTTYPAVYKNAIFLTEHTRGWVRAVWLEDVTNRLLGQVTINANAVSAVTIESGPAIYQGDMFYLNLNAGQLRRISFGDAPPEAFAAAVPSGGLPPLTVRFTSDGSGDSKNRALNIVWDFGDGSPTSTDPNPWHTYTTVGDFTAKLSVTAGGTVVTDSVAISTRAPTPKVSITAPALGSKYPPGSDVTFVADLSENTAPMTFAWDLWLVHEAHYHPQTAVSATPTQKWFLEGFTVDNQRISYRAIATATNSAGHSTSAMTFLSPTGAPNAGPVPFFSSSVTTGAAPLQVTFDTLGSADPDGDNMFFTWDFGDQSPPAEGATVRHIFGFGGTYTVNLTAADNFGGRASVQHNIVVTGPAPPVRTTAPPATPPPTTEQPATEPPTPPPATSDGPGVTESTNTGTTEPTSTTKGSGATTRSGTTHTTTGTTSGATTGQLIPAATSSRVSGNSNAAREGPALAIVFAITVALLVAQMQ